MHICSAAVFTQAWCRDLEVVDVCVELEGVTRRFDNEWSRTRSGAPHWRASGLLPALQDELLEDERFERTLQNTEVGCRRLLYRRRIDAGVSRTRAEAVLVVVWCRHGKHRSVGFAELLEKLLSDKHGALRIHTDHLERARWDHEWRDQKRLRGDYSKPFCQWVQRATFNDIRRGQATK